LLDYLFASRDYPEIEIQVTLYYLPTDNLELTLKRLTALSHLFGRHSNNPAIFLYSIKPAIDGPLGNYEHTYVNIQGYVKNDK
jgi:hypothetical protein